MYGLQMCETWLYDDKKPFVYLQLADTYKALRRELDTSFYEEMISSL